MFRSYVIIMRLHKINQGSTVSIYESPNVCFKVHNSLSLAENQIVYVKIGTVSFATS